MGDVHGLERALLHPAEEGLRQGRDIPQGGGGEEADVLRLRQELAGIGGAEDGAARRAAEKEAGRAVLRQGEAGQWQAGEGREGGGPGGLIAEKFHWLTP